MGAAAASDGGIAHARSLVIHAISGWTNVRYAAHVARRYCCCIDVRGTNRCGDTELSDRINESARVDVFHQETVMCPRTNGNRLGVTVPRRFLVSCRDVRIPDEPKQLLDRCSYRGEE